jgi:hypothetical protein
VVCQPAEARFVYIGVRRILVALLLLALSVPTGVAAQVVPPGNSGIDQYQESLPGAGGDRPTGPTGSAKGNVTETGSASESGGLGEPHVSPSTAQRLNKLGPDGRATAAVAAATAPRKAQGSSGSDSSGDTGAGMGWALPLILVLTLTAAVSIAVLRHRRRAPPGAA